MLEKIKESLKSLEDAAQQLQAPPDDASAMARWLHERSGALLAAAMKTRACVLELELELEAAAQVAKAAAEHDRQIAERDRRVAQAEAALRAEQESRRAELDRVRAQAQAEETARLRRDLAAFESCDFALIERTLRERRQAARDREQLAQTNLLGLEAKLAGTPLPEGPIEGLDPAEAARAAAEREKAKVLREAFGAQLALEQQVLAACREELARTEERLARLQASRAGR